MMLNKRAVGLFTSYETTEAALCELRDRGFLMDRVSLVGRDVQRQTEVTGVHTSDRITDVGTLHTHENDAGDAAKTGAVAGTTLGGLTGLLVGLGAIAIPGVGPVMLAGAAATAIASTISGGLIGAAAGSLAGGLVGLGIPHDRAEVYSDRVSKGDYLILVEGSDVDIDLAESVFRNRGIHEWYTYDLPTESVATTTRPVHNPRV